jgi:hypothetical protein
MTAAQMRAEIAADPFLTFAVRDLIGKGVEETHAMQVVLNTYSD